MWVGNAPPYSATGLGLFFAHLCPVWVHGGCCWLSASLVSLEGNSRPFLSSVRTVPDDDMPKRCCGKEAGRNDSQRTTDETNTQPSEDSQRVPTDSKAFGIGRAGVSPSDASDTVLGADGQLAGVDGAPKRGRRVNYMMLRGCIVLLPKGGTNSLFR